MNLFRNFGVGIGAYSKAINIILNNGLWWFLLFPLALNILFLVFGMFGINSLSKIIEQWLVNKAIFDANSFTGASYFLPISSYLSGIIGGLVWIVFKILFFFIFSTIGGYLVIIFLSPVFAVLSEKTDSILTGKKYPFNPDRIMRDVIRGVLIALRNFCIEIGYILLVFILSFFIPVLGGIIGAIILFFIAAYFYGFSFVDYTNERKRYSIKQSVQFIRKNKGMVIANGMVFSFFMLVPFFGTTLAGFVAIISVVAATVSVHQVDSVQHPSLKE